jgi:adenine-specific DNA-methyltransferase
MNEKYEKLKSLLNELFQLDRPDLDFGLYRIMHAKSAEVAQFLDNDLLPQIKAAFATYKTANKADFEKELARAIEHAHDLGAEPEQLPKVKELRAKLSNEAVDVAALRTAKRWLRCHSGARRRREPGIQRRAWRSPLDSGHRADRAVPE